MITLDSESNDNVTKCMLILWSVIHCSFIINRKTSDVPEYHKEEAEMIVPAYGYFIRGAQTTFSGVVRYIWVSEFEWSRAVHVHVHVHVKLLLMTLLCQSHLIRLCLTLLQGSPVEVHPVQDDRIWLWISEPISLGFVKHKTPEKST